ncbi:MAG: sodium-independent anion transporter, partial [Ignavibacteriae bacterium HGW-Ignavibacteriae-1]
MFRPKLFTTLKHYNRAQFLADLQAGIIVGILAIPLAIAFAIASGVSPEKGLFTAFIAGFIISCLGGSRVQIGGPTGAFIVIVYGIVQKYGFDGLVVATFLAGIILIIMGLAKLGTVIQFIPYPVVVGFTSGIALIIFSTQIKDFLGLNITEVPGDFIGKWGSYFQNLHSVNWYALLMAVGTILILVYWKKISTKLPGAFIAIILMTVATLVFEIPVETIGAKYQIPTSLPTPVFPSFNWDIIKNLFSPALTIAILAGVESLLSAVVADGMIGGSH